MYSSKEELIKAMIDCYDLFVLYGISKDSIGSIIELNSLHISDSDLDYLIQKGRIFLNREDAIARYDYIKALMLPYNDNRIFDPEKGKLIIDANDQSVQKLYNIKSAKYSDSLEFWTLNFFCDYDLCHHGFSVIPLVYTYEGYWLFYDSDCHYEQRPAILFATKEDAEAAYREVEKHLNEKPHPLDYWFDGYSYTCFSVAMENDYSSRAGLEKLPEMIMDAYCPKSTFGRNLAISRMEEILKSEEGLYRKKDSMYGIELVLRTEGSEWQFRNNMVLVNEEWVPVSILFPMLGIRTDADIVKTFDIETEQIMLTEQNCEDYVGRKLLYGINEYWSEDFVDEDTGEIKKINRRDSVLERFETLSVENMRQLTFPLQVTLLKNNDDKMVNFLDNLQWSGYGLTLAQLSSRLTGYLSDTESEMYANCSKYMKATTRLSKTGEMRLSKALHEVRSDYCEETAKVMGSDKGEEILHYGFGQGYVTPDDFVEIIKLLACNGDGYHTMSDKSAYSLCPNKYDTTLDNNTAMSDIICQRKGEIPEMIIKNESLLAEVMYKECFEIDYELHCDVPLI